MSDMSTHVCFLKRENSDDDYRSVFTSSGFPVSFEPVLDIQFVNQEILQSKLLNSEHYDGLIITSRRSVDAICTLLDKCNEGVKQRILDAWSDCNLFTVGKSSASQLPIQFKTIHTSISDSHQLALIVLGLLSTPKTTSSKPWKLLFLCSSIRLDTLPLTLNNSKYIDLHELTVYATTSSTTNLQSLPENSWWVFFSPSGVEAVFSLTSISSTSKIAAIGKTTSDYLQQKGILVHAISEKPCATSLLEAIVSSQAGIKAAESSEI